MNFVEHGGNVDEVVSPPPAPALELSQLRFFMRTNQGKNKHRPWAIIIAFLVSRYDSYLFFTQVFVLLVASMIMTNVDKC